MKFSEEQIGKVTAIRQEFIEKLKMFKRGIYYAKRMFAPDEKFDTSWIEKVINNILDLYLEEMKILDDINIIDLEETEFYVCLGQYFERIYLSWKGDQDDSILWFETSVNQYKKDIMVALKSQ